MTYLQAAALNLELAFVAPINTHYYGTYPAMNITTVSYVLDVISQAFGQHRRGVFTVESRFQRRQGAAKNVPARVESVFCVRAFQLPVLCGCFPFGRC